MEMPPYLKYQDVPGKRRSSSRTLFNLLFVLSVGLNIYFLMLDNSWSQADRLPAAELEAVADAAEPPAATGAATSIHEEEPAQANPAGETPPYEVKRALYEPPDHFPGRNIQVQRFKIQSSLNHTVCRTMSVKDGCSQFSAHLGRLLAWFIDTNRDMRNGDTLSVVYERLENEDRFKILQMKYESAFLGKTMEANFFKGTGMSYGGYFDRQGREIAQRISDPQTPIADYIEITSLPGDFRRGRRGHTGTDFKAEVGTPVRATFDGRVTRTNWNVRANGYCVEIDHPNEGIKTRFLHLSRVLVKRGQYVKQGQNIARSGNTGRTFAPHLHYEILSRNNKKTIYNPFDFKYHKTYHREISSQEKRDYQERVRLYDTVLQENRTGGESRTG